MERSSYSDYRDSPYSPGPDYVFGQRMLTLRSAIGLTQARLAQHLGVSRRAVVKWESGTRYPSAEHLRKYIEYAIQQGAFPLGHEQEEIRSLWQASRQKVLLDEAWVTSLLRHVTDDGRPTTDDRPSDPESPVDEPKANYRPSSVPPGPRLDWGGALSVPTFYGRTWEMDTLTLWTVEESCRVVGVLGLGGIGKSALAVSLMHHVAQQFDAVIWRSLRDAPTIDALLDDCLQGVAPQVLAAGDSSDNGEPLSTQGRLKAFLAYMRHTRILLVLDNLETVLEEGAGTDGYQQGVLREGYEGFSWLLRLVAETEHRSCLLFTSRENPSELVPFEGVRSPVRTLRLARLEAEACDSLLAEKEVRGTARERANLIDAYTGNPLALRIVAQTIVDLFGGEPGPFLEQGGVIFGGVRALLAEQFNRLSPLEQHVMVWLAIMREPATMEELRALFVTPASAAQLLEAVEALHRRSLIERGQKTGTFTLQSVVLEYGTSRLIASLSREIEQGRLERTIEHGLSLAQSPEYVRQTQERLIVAPILEQVRSRYASSSALEEQLRALLDQLRLPTGLESSQFAHGYGPANVLALLRLLKGDLRGVDLSRLTFQNVYLQGVEMQDATLMGAVIRDCIFTEAFAGIRDIAISGNGQYGAACSGAGDVRLWALAGATNPRPTLQRIWQSPIDIVLIIALSPDGAMLAGGCFDGEIKVWATGSGALLWQSSRYASTGRVRSLAFSPDGRLLAAGVEGAAVQLWDVQTGTALQTLPHPDLVQWISWSPGGPNAKPGYGPPKGRAPAKTREMLLATGDKAGVVRLWAVNPVDQAGRGGQAVEATCKQMLAGHTLAVLGLAFAPDGSTIASASLDGSVKLWESPSGRLRATLPEQSDEVLCIAWSPDGRTLAYAVREQTIWLWDIAESSNRAALRGHTAEIRRLAFTPDSRTLLSGSEDGTLRVWDAHSGQCVQIMHGHVVALTDAAWSPDGTQLVGAGDDSLVLIYDASGATPPRLLRRCTTVGVDWSPDGRRLAIMEWVNVIRICDSQTGEDLQILQHPTDPHNRFFGVAWSPDGQWLASGTPRHGVLVWDMREPGEVEQGQGQEQATGRFAPQTGARWRWPPPDQPFPTPLGCGVYWSPDGAYLAAGGEDGIVYVWDARDGTLLQELKGHHSRINTVGWSPGGRLLASGSSSPKGGELFVWNPARGERIRTFADHPGIVVVVAWGPNEDQVISGGSDGMLRWWNMHSGACEVVRPAHQGWMQYLKSSPDGTKVASFGQDGAIMLWDRQTGAPVRTLRRDRPYERLDFTGIQGLTEAQKATLRALGAIERDAV